MAKAKCPTCDGDGFVPLSFYEKGEPDLYECDSCGGSGWIESLPSPSTVKERQE